MAEKMEKDVETKGRSALCSGQLVQMNAELQLTRLWVRDVCEVVGELLFLCEWSEAL